VNICQKNNLIYKKNALFDKMFNVTVLFSCEIKAKQFSNLFLNFFILFYLQQEEYMPMREAIKNSPATKIATRTSKNATRTTKNAKRTTKHAKRTTKNATRTTKNLQQDKRAG
jgi:hypothetical protein